MFPLNFVWLSSLKLEDKKAHYTFLKNLADESIDCNTILETHKVINIFKFR